MIVTIVSGFSRSGKSTIQRELKQRGYNCNSSSDILSVETLKYYSLPITERNLEILEHKLEKDFQDEFKRVNGCYPILDTRNSKIYVAEQVLVPRHSRKFFTDQLVYSLDFVESKPQFLFSTIPTERVYLYDTLDKLLSHPEDTVCLVDLRSKQEKTRVDSRGLIKDDELHFLKNPTYYKEIWRDGLSVDETIDLLLEFTDK